MGNYIFVSYAHKDKKIINEAVKALSSNGIRLWYDHGIKAGADWAKSIGVNLQQASLMLLFLSKSSIKSKNVRREISFAQENNITILTVQLGKIKLDEQLSKSLAVNQFVNLKAQKTYDNFAKTVKEYLGKFECIDENPVKKYKDKKIRIKTGIVWKIILLVIVLAVAGLILVNKMLYSEAPVVIGMLSKPAENRVNQSGFETAVGLDYTKDEDIGYIYRQNYSGKTLKNNQIVLTESLGPEEDLTEVPSVIGYHLTDAVAKLVEANMKSFVINPVTTDEYQIAYVADQSIAAGYKVSAKNKIELSVSSELGSTIEIFGQTVTMTDTKIQLDVDEEGGFSFTPLTLMAVDVDYTETDPISVDNNINATMNVKMNVSREDTQPFGRFRGNFEFNCDMDGDSSLMWGAIKAVLAEDGKVSLVAKSDSFTINLEEWDENKYSEFAISATGSESAVQRYDNPVAMALVSEIPLTYMNKGMKSVSNLMHYANMFSVSLPDVKGDILYQSYSIVIQENGEAWVTLYNTGETQKAMNFHGNISYTLPEEYTE